MSPAQHAMSNRAEIAAPSVRILASSWMVAWAIAVGSLAPALAQEDARRPVPEPPAPDEASQARTEAWRALLERSLSGPIDLDASGLAQPGAAAAPGFWSTHVGRFLAPRSLQSAVRFEDVDAPETFSAEWPVGFDQLPRQVVAREFGGGVVIAAACITFDAGQRTAVAWLRWELANDGAPTLRCIAQTVVGGLVPAGAERIDASSIGELEIAQWDPSSMRATLVVGLREGQAYALSIPFQGRPGTAASDLHPRGRWLLRPEEDVDAEHIGAGRDVRATVLDGRLLVSLRSIRAPSGGVLASGRLPLQLVQRGEAGVWTALHPAGDVPRVGVEYASWIDDQGTLRWSTLTAGEGQELRTFALEAAADGAWRWSKPRSSEAPAGTAATRLALAGTPHGAALIARSVDGSPLRTPLAD